MKKIILMVLLLSLSSIAAANITVYGGFNKMKDHKFGIQGGANYFTSAGKFLLGIDGSYTMATLDNGITDSDSSIIEIMPIIRQKSQFFLQGGVGLEFFSVDIAGSSNSSTELGLMVGAGYKLNKKFVVDGRAKIIDSEISFFGNIGFRI